MTKALTIAVMLVALGMTAGSAQAGYCYWAGDGVCAPPPFCGYDVRRRGYPAATEYYFVYRCFGPRPIRYWRHRKVLRSRG